tara:strand:- start:119 stop:556 length:438 start_codon:yes stop_codon:yes gene_type:complete
MTERPVKYDADMEPLIALLHGRKKPFTVNITDGLPRTIDQNKLQRKWMNEAAEQLQTDTAEDFRGYCKLHFGVAILKAADDAFAAEYDEVIRPMTYEAKLKLMKVPFDFGITRKMKTNQKSQYLDKVFAHFSNLGVQLTVPEGKL